jgi:hypothetical protein
MVEVVHSPPPPTPPHTYIEVLDPIISIYNIILYYIYCSWVHSL